MAVSGCDFRRSAKHSWIGGSLRRVCQAEMGDQFCLYVLLRLRLGVGRVGSIRLQYGVRRAVVSVPRQTGVGDLRLIHNGPGGDSGSGGRHAGTDLPDGYPDILPVRVRCDHGDHSRGLSARPPRNFRGGGGASSSAVSVHLAAGTSGFVAAAVVGPRLLADRENFPPNSLLVTLIGAGILWLGWNGFNGGDPYFANHDAGAA